MKYILITFIFLSVASQSLAQREIANYTCLRRQGAYWDKEKKDWVTVGGQVGAGLTMVFLEQNVDGSFVIFINEDQFNILRRVYYNDTNVEIAQAWVVYSLKLKKEMQILLKVQKKSKAREMWVTIPNYSQTYYYMEQDYFKNTPKY